MISVELVFTVDLTNTTTNETTTREERAQFYYRPDEKRFEQLDGGTLRSMCHKVVALGAGGSKAELINGGKYKDAAWEFTVTRASTPLKINGGSVVRVSSSSPSALMV